MALDWPTGAPSSLFLKVSNKETVTFIGDDVFTVFYLFADITVFLFTLVEPLRDCHGQESMMET